MLSRDMDYQAEGAIVCHSVEETLQELVKYPSGDVFIIGGQSIYEQFLPYCDAVRTTYIDYEYQADTWLPNLDKDGDWVMDLENEEEMYFNLCYSFRRYARRRHQNK